MRKEYLLIIFAALLIVSGCAGPPRVYRKKEIKPEKPAVKRVIILDPGHGGKLKGAVGPTGLMEKKVVLDIAKRLEKLLENKGSYEVHLTRRRDVDLGLVKRRKFAVNYDADLFISIHCDGHKRKTVNGTSVYVLSNKGVNIVRERALTDGDYLLDRYNNTGDKDRYLKKTVVDLIQVDTRKESHLLAEMTVKTLARRLGTKNLGVRKANFAVLKNVDVPSILVEVAFITNWWEEKLLKDPSVRQKAAQSLADSIRDYFEPLW